MAIGQRLALAAIDAYKRWVSPFKGYACAYRVHTGADSCSTLGARAIRRYGLARGLGILRERTFLCGVAHRRYAAATTRRPAVQQRGDCDIGCDAPDCDVLNGRTAGRVCEFLSCCDCGPCDGWRRKQEESPRSRRRSKRQGDVHLPHRPGIDPLPDRQRPTPGP